MSDLWIYREGKRCFGFEFENRDETKEVMKLIHNLVSEYKHHQQKVRELGTKERKCLPFKVCLPCQHFITLEDVNRQGDEEKHWRWCCNILYRILVKVSAVNSIVRIKSVKDKKGDGSWCKYEPKIHMTGYRFCQHEGLTCGEYKYMLQQGTPPQGDYAIPLPTGWQ